MKKTIAVLFSLASVAAFAVGNDLLISFSTPGPDVYADGTPVVAGECYSLVCTKADGSQEIVLNYQTKCAGKCSRVVYVVDETTAETYEGGTWGVYLLDTRDFNKDGKPSGLDDKGQPKVLNVKAAVSSASITDSGNFGSASASEGIAAEKYDLVAANVPQPEVKGIKIVGENVVVTVAKTRPFVAYTLISSKDAQTFSTPAPTGKSGDESGDIDIMMKKPEEGGVQFFKVSTVQTVQ